MSATAYLPDRRTEADALRELSAIAAATALPASLLPPGAGDPGPRTWGELLFDGERLHDPGEPSQALLAGLAQAQATLWEHYDALPARARRWWLEERLGIAARGPVPDRVLAVVEGDPKRLPRSIEAGAALSAKDAAGAPRRYRTREALRVTGARVAGVHSYGVLANGRDVVGRGRDHAGLAGGTFHPFGIEGDTAAPHELYVASELLRFSSGTLEVTLELHGVSFPGLGTATEGMKVLGQLDWWVSRPGAPLRVARPSVAHAGAGKLVLGFVLTEGAGPLALGGTERTWLRASWPAEGELAADLALALRFSHATLTARGKNVRPQSGAAGDGLLDLSKEFEPFGPVPRRGDAFYIRSDEALAKPLGSLTVALDPLSGTQLKSASYRDIRFDQVRRVAESIAQALGKSKELTEDQIEQALAATEATRAVAWQTYREGAGWETLGQPATSFETVTRTPAAGRPASDAAEVAGASGHFVRAFLSQGDFGWQEYQDKVAHNAAEAANGPGGDVKKVVPPDPPVLRGVTLSYTSAAAASNAAEPRLRLFARNGLSEAIEVGRAGDVSPFAQDQGGHRGAMYLGLLDVPPGEVVTLYVEIDEAAACSALDRRAEFAWEYRAGEEGWRSLRVLDGTRGLRHTGILRFVAPPGWQEGAPETDEGAALWLRARTDRPELSGMIRRILTDAVEAEYMLAGPSDPLPASPLPAGGVTGLARAVVGVKRVANPAPSWGGRAAEEDPQLFARGAQTLRHRGRAVSAWDVEQLVLEGFPEVGRVRCLPHHSPDSECAPGWMGVVVLRRSEDRLPHPSVRLASEIEDWLGGRATPHARIAVLCPELVEVSVAASVQLRRGIPAGDAAESIETRLREFLHPWLTTREGADWGVSLYRSSVVAFLEALYEVDFVRSLAFDGLPANTERIDTDPCRGLIASAAQHRLALEAAL